MKINQPFRSRRDLECHIVFFRGDAPLEMTEVAAFITNLLSADRTREELIALTASEFPQLVASEEVDYTVEVLTGAGVLALD